MSRTTQNQFCKNSWGVTICLLSVATMLVAAMISTQPAVAQTYTVFYNFNGGDGASPLGGLIFDSDGNLYGTGRWGGIPKVAQTYTYGVVFKLDPGGNETVLHSFSWPDGANPDSSVLRNGSVLYGTTEQGGSHGLGVLYSLNALGAFRILYNFGDTDQDGANPTTDLVRDQQNLYGTTFWGGSYNAGTIYKFDRNGKVSVLYSFTWGSDGGHPSGDMILGPGGNLYGTTFFGGGSNCGVVFKLEVSSGTFSVLYDFQGLDGYGPQGRLAADTEGNLYGTTWGGGTYNAGVVFKLDRFGNFTVLHNFEGSPNDGAAPEGGVTRDPNGNLYGTTAWGGENDGWGAVFKLDTNGTYTVLHKFNVTDGNRPEAPVTIDAQGNLYGTTSAGGIYGEGVVFKITP